MDLSDRFNKGELDNQIINAVLKDDLDALKRCLALGASPNQRHEYLDHRPTVLMKAARALRVDFVAALIDAGAELDAQDKNGSTAVHYAIRAGCFATVKFLAEQGASLKIKDNGGNNALMCAVEDRRDDILAYLLTKDIELNDRNLKGETALIIAANKGTFSAVRSLLYKDGVNLEETDHAQRTAIDYAIVRSSGDVVKMFIDKGANLVWQNGTALHAAVENTGTPSNKIIVEALLEKNMDVYARNHTGKTALWYAELNEQADPETFKMMCAAADKQNMAREIIRKQRHDEMVKEICSQGLKIVIKVPPIFRQQLK